MLEILFLLTFWAWPWTPEGLEIASQANIYIQQPPCWTMAWYESATETIYLCGNLHYTTMIHLLRHEMQHYLADQYDVFAEQDEQCTFLHTAAHAMSEDEYLEWQIYIAQPTEYNCSLEGEVHAELPSTLKVHLPFALQPWYPWFALEPITSSFMDLFLSKTRHAACIVRILDRNP